MRSAAATWFIVAVVALSCSASGGQAPDPQEPEKTPTQATSGGGEDFTARCVEVEDGDTITLLRDGFRKVRVRLEGIDCPEKGVPFSEKATRMTRALTSNKQVSFRFKEIDRYQRRVGRVIVDGIDVSLALVLAGLAKQAKEYSDDPIIAAAEHAAKQAGIGIWSKVEAVPPATGVFHGNRRSEVFHGESCRYFNCKNCTRIFETKQAALDAGFRPHKDCVDQ